MFFVVWSDDSFNFPLGWIKYIVVVVILIRVSELRSCVKVEVALLGSPSLIVFMVSVDVKHRTWILSRHVRRRVVPVVSVHYHHRHYLWLGSEVEVTPRPHVLGGQIGRHAELLPWTLWWVSSTAWCCCLFGFCLLVSAAWGGHDEWAFLFHSFFFFF